MTIVTCDHCGMLHVAIVNYMWPLSYVIRDHCGMWPLWYVTYDHCGMLYVIIGILHVIIGMLHVIIGKLHMTIVVCYI